MLQLATVHFGSSAWIPIQTERLRRHLSVPYRVWASLEEIEPGWDVHFDRVIPQVGRHAGKLNHLAFEISLEAEDSDLLVFLDGDAFPIADPMPLIQTGLAAAPLVAVLRSENTGDRQPHPCFCATTVGAWKAIGGDWSESAIWPTSIGNVSDVGGNLMRRLEAAKTPWTPILRTNTHNPHPLFFGVYGHSIYHHGAGFRVPWSRADRDQIERDLPPPETCEYQLYQQRWQAAKARVVRRNEALSQQLFERIRTDDPSWISDLDSEHL